MFFSILKLIRLPNIFTAISNIWAAVFIANGGNFPFPDVLFATLASATLYGGGIALNDYFDRDYDKQFRPERPIPSGSVSARTALLIGVSLLVLGVASGFMISLLGGVITSAIALFVLLYDGFLKRWFFPCIISMGLCRGLNWGLGLEAGGEISTRFIFFPIAIFVYIAGLTAVAKFETKKPVFKKVVVAGVLLIPLIDGSIVFAYGYWWQGLMVCMLIVPAVIFSKIFEVS